MSVRSLAPTRSISEFATQAGRANKRWLEQATKSAIMQYARAHRQIDTPDLEDDLAGALRAKLEYIVYLTEHSLISD